MGRTVLEPEWVQAAIAYLPKLQTIFNQKRPKTVKITINNFPEANN